MASLSSAKELFTQEVEKLLSHDLDGDGFFNQVDALCQQERFAIPLINWALQLNSRCVVTGGFGHWCYRHQLLNEFATVVLAPGGLRLGGPTRDQDLILQFDGSFHPLDTYVFIDDTFYSGTTRSKCTTALTAQARGIISSSVVMYDGAHMLSTNSLYRYWKHHSNRIEEVRCRQKTT